MSANSKICPPDSLIFFAAELEIENDETNTLCDNLPVPSIFPEITTALPSSVNASIFFRLTVFLLELDFKAFLAIFDHIGASLFLEAMKEQYAVVQVHQ